MDEYINIDSLIEKLKFKLKGSLSHEKRESIKKLIRMYEEGEDVEGFSYIDPELTFYDFHGVLAEALYNARQIEGFEWMNIDDLLRYRPSRKYMEKDFHYKAKHNRNDFIQKTEKTVKCKICGRFDNYSEVRGKLCIDCFCRETWNIIHEAAKYSIKMTFNDAGEWVRLHDFKKDDILTISTKAHDTLMTSAIWNKIDDIFKREGIWIGRWNNADVWK